MTRYGPRKGHPGRIAFGPFRTGGRCAAHASGIRQRRILFGLRSVRVCAGMLAVALLWVCADRVSAGTVRTQSIPLQQGWNAVFVEVAPSDPDPAVVFDGAPVEIVATHFADRSPTQFLRDPDEQPWTASGWSVWYAASRPDAFLSKLHAIQANRPYLIKATAAYTLNLFGEVKFRPIVWQPNSLNFVGLHTDPGAPPSVGAFFAGSNSHAGQRIYKLVDGRWTLVTNIGGEPLVPGQALWVGCAQGSAFQGPLTVTIPFGDRLDFGAHVGAQTIGFSNAGTVPLAVTLTDVGQSLPLACRVFDLTTGETTYHDLPGVLDLGVLEPGASTSLVLMVKREEFTQATPGTVLKIATDNGVLIHLAATAETRAD